MPSPIPVHFRMIVLIAIVSLLLGAAPALAAQGTNTSLAVPLLVDGPGGRLYGRVSVDGAAHHIGVYSARDGKPLASFPYAGPFSLDPAGQRLFVMTAANRVAVLDAPTGKLIRSFAVSIDPASKATNGLAPQALNAAPQYDVQAGQLLVFVGNRMHTVEPGTGKVLASKAFDVQTQGGCGTPNGPLPINRTFFDAARRLLYLEFTTYSCTPWVGFTVVAYDVAKGQELSRRGTNPYSALAADGGFYAMSWYRMGIGMIWSEAGGQPATYTEGWSGGGPFQFDAPRKRLYQSGDSAVRIFDPAGMTLTAVVPQPVKGTLAAYDARTDQVYFVDGAIVRPYLAGRLRAAAGVPVKVKTLPHEPVGEIVSSPNWTKDKTLFALWSRPFSDTACFVFQQSGGSLLRSTDGGKAWMGGAAGLGKDCALLSALAISPGYAKDRTLLAGVKGNGVFRSTDGGLTWEPSSKGLAHMAVTGLALSPAFATDRIAFAAVLDKGLQRSLDGGRTWQTLPTAVNPTVALSPEFDQDGALVVAGSIQGSAVLQMSEDRGASWRKLTVPSERSVQMLSLAPAFARWHVMLLGDGNGDVYRSTDGGQTWRRVLQTSPGAASGTSYNDRMQIVYGPNEEHREVFVVATGMRYEDEKQIASGRMFRSGDGGQTWIEMSTISGGAPSALAISPSYAQDGTLFVGTAEGEILHIQPGVLQWSQPSTTNGEERE